MLRVKLKYPNLGGRICPKFCNTIELCVRSFNNNNLNPSQTLIERQLRFCLLLSIKFNAK